jgi:hypothetical protein
MCSQYKRWVQAAGRVIRTQTDTGAVLMDDRYQGTATAPCCQVGGLLLYLNSG